MHNKLIAILIIIGVNCALLCGQNMPNYPQGDFINPLEIPLSLAGNFGELRGNHFHSGFDFRTNGEEGYLIRAVADGYVSRIKVSAFGYGNALYITHKNGYVSVYGHLQRYDSIISNYVFKKQYELESYEVDLFPQKNEIIVTQGQLIALSGNTGGSEGPHLHFEIRDQKTEETINPYFFGFAIEDTIAPTIEGIAIYPLEMNSMVNGSYKVKYVELKKTEINNYALKEEIILSGKIGFGLITYDIENGSSNKNGTYSYLLNVDTSQLFKYACNRFEFDQTRYINAHLDFEKMKQNKDRYQRCFLLPNNKIHHYTTDERKGVYDFNDTLHHTVTIKALDFKNNSSTFEMVCKSKIATHLTIDKLPKEIFAFNKTNLLKKEDVLVELPLNCLYEDSPVKYAKTAGTGKLLSDIHHVLNEETPVHFAYTLSIKPKTKALKKNDKLLIVSIDEEGHPSSEGGTFENGFVIAKLKHFGNFAVMMDTTAPSAKLLNYDKENSVFKHNEIKLKISDDLSGIKSYKGSIDDAWVLMVHDNKEKTLTYTFDEKLLKTEGEHIFMVIIVDKKGNSKKLTSKFKY
jgi:murein DD-endopeptidase MepM/ murein hydrolase activator NlpD